MHTPARTHTNARTHTHTHAHTRAHTHDDAYREPRHSWGFTGGSALSERTVRAEAPPGRAGLQCAAGVDLHADDVRAGERRQVRRHELLRGFRWIEQGPCDRTCQCESVHNVCTCANARARARACVRACVRECEYTCTYVCNEHTLGAPLHTLDAPSRRFDENAPSSRSTASRRGSSHISRSTSTPREQLISASRTSTCAQPTLRRVAVVAIAAPVRRSRGAALQMAAARMRAILPRAHSPDGRTYRRGLRLDVHVQRVERRNCAVARYRRIPLQLEAWVC